MFTIGAVINTSVEGIDQIIQERNKAELVKIAQMQIECGAKMLAINCGTRINTEVEDIEWMFRTIQNEIEVPLCIDSPNPEAHEAGLRVHRHGKPMVDSITGEKERIDSILPLVKKYDAMVTAILHDESGMPDNVEDRLKIVPKIETAIQEHEIPPADVYLDCMVFPISVDSNNGKIYLETLKRVKAEYPSYKTICGLNNISYGLPQEDILNTAFLSMCSALGQDAAYVEITRESGAFIRAIKALNGEDLYTMNYIEAFRASQLDIFTGNSE